MLLPITIAEVFDLMGDQFIRNEALQDGFEVARDVTFAPQADHLIQIPEVW